MNLILLIKFIVSTLWRVYFDNIIICGNSNFNSNSDAFIFLQKQDFERKERS